MPRYSKSDEKTLLLFGENLRKYRSEKQWSQELLAEKADLHRTYVSSAERGQRNVALLNLIKIAKALEIPIAQLIPK